MLFSEYIIASVVVLLLVVEMAVDRYLFNNFLRNHGNESVTIIGLAEKILSCIQS